MEIVRRLKARIAQERLDRAGISVLLRYTASGCSSALFQFGALAFFVERMQADPTLASGISFVLACVLNYLMLYHWTFRSNGRHRIIALRYTVVTMLTLCVNLTVFWLLTDVFSVYYIVSQMFAVVFVAVFNFLINRSYTFI